MIVSAILYNSDKGTITIYTSLNTFWLRCDFCVTIYLPYVTQNKCSNMLSINFVQVSQQQIYKLSAASSMTRGGSVFPCAMIKSVCPAVSSCDKQFRKWDVFYILAPRIHSSEVSHPPKRAPNAVSSVHTVFVKQSWTAFSTCSYCIWLPNVQI